VTILIVTSLLGLVHDLTTTEELLGVGVVIKDDTKSGSHVDDLTIAVNEAVLTRISASVTIDVLEFVSHVRLVIVDRVVTVGLSDLTNPGLNSHELLTLASILGSEHVIIDTVLKLASLASLLIEFGTRTAFLMKFIVVVIVSRGGIRSP